MWQMLPSILLKCPKDGSCAQNVVYFFANSGSEFNKLITPLQTLPHPCTLRMFGVLSNSDLSYMLSNLLSKE